MAGSVKEVMDTAAASEDVEKVTNTADSEGDSEGEVQANEESSTSTMDERKKKLDQLRRRMVSTALSCPAGNIQFYPHRQLHFALYSVILHGRTVLNS